MWFESGIFAKGTREGGKKTHTPKKTHGYFLLKSRKSTREGLQVSKILSPCTANRSTLWEMQLRVHFFSQTTSCLKFFIVLMENRRKHNIMFLSICFNKEKKALFTCVRFSRRDCKRYEGGDSKHTIYFERPYLISWWHFSSLDIQDKFI